MALRGRVEDDGLVDVLQLVVQQSKSGVLRVGDDQRDVRLTVVRGAAVAAFVRGSAQSTAWLSRLGRLGVLDPDGLRRALAAQDALPSRGAVAHVLVDELSADLQAVRAALRRDLREVALELFLWTRGEVAFTSTLVEIPDIGPEPVRLEGLMLDGLNLRREWAQTQADQPPGSAKLFKVGPIPDAVDTLDLAFAESVSLDLGSVEVDEFERSVYDRVSDGVSYQALMDESPIDHFTTRRSVVRLLKQGFLRASATAPAAVFEDSTWSQLGAEMDRAPRPEERMPSGYVALAPAASWALGRIVLAHRDGEIEPVRLATVDDPARVRALDAQFDAVMQIATRAGRDQVDEVLDHGRIDGGGLYWATRATNAASLAEWRAAQGPPAPGAMCALCVQAASCLRSVHAQGVLHNQLSSASFEVSEGGDLHLVDLPEALLDALSPGGRSGQWWRYASPERMRHEAVDERSDIYAVGAVMYEMICGSPPHAGADENARDTSEESRPFHEVVESVEIPLGLEMIIQRCLFLRPSRRYQDASSLVRALEAVRAQANEG
ncbi:MAG: DUF4388 domain-containing protein [Deltaproteobacteria bacterium]|nr:DUF4388 domain-containing protein [Deltaproteobacteria bacterium]